MNEAFVRRCEGAAQVGASDLFFREGEPPRMRLHGRIGPLDEADLPTVSREDLESFFRECGVDPETVRDRDVHWQTGGWRFRVNCFRHTNGLGVVLRVVRTHIESMEALHLPVALLEAWLKRPYGLILITGPTGCGKSTTVASMLDSLNQWREAHVITIEDPIEFLFREKHCLFTQREIPADVADFTGGLRSALRQSPDVIFVGEIRDCESAKIALQAAETGHLVISTLHTSTVTETMERLTHLLPAAERQGVLSLLATQLIGVLTQKLLPSTRGDRYLVTEYFQNEGATRDWIMAMDYARLGDFIHAGASGRSEGFVRALHRAWAEGYVEAEVVLGATSRPQELQRTMRGVSG